MITINLIRAIVINMEITEEFLEELQSKYNCYMIDNFYSTDRLKEITTQTAYSTKEIFQLKMSTGIQANSTIKLYYDLSRFNPHFSKAYFRLTFDSIKDIFAFVGFKKSFGDPTFTMTESHSALVVNSNKVYLSTGNEIGVVMGYQNTEISGLDLTKDVIVRIDKNKLYSMPLPQIVPYLDSYRIIAADRVWTQKAMNATSPPEDVTHYIMFFLKNLTNEDKKLTFRHFCYLEEFVD